MALYNQLMDRVIALLWGLPTFVIMLGVGILFTIWSRFIQYRALTHGLEVIRGKYDDRSDPGAINHFQALSAALSGTVGLGNIGGVALAIGMGGPGALFWMWVTGFLGMAIKAVEVTLAMKYRDTSDPDNPHGGAMWVITRGFGDRVGGVWRPLSWWFGAFFCVTLLISTLTGGNMFQAWNVAAITNQYFGVPTVATGIVLAMITGAVILGGIKRIGDVAGRLVPFMCGLYLLAGIAVLIVKAADVPALLALVVREAFSPTEATGAFLGATAWFGLTTGLRRALFSNEAGQGTSPIAHSAAKTNEPVREGVVAGLEPFIDTCLVCTLTALVILVTGTWNRDHNGPFKGPLELVEKDGAWTVEASTSIDHLPELPAPDRWQAGNKFYVLARVPGTRHVDRDSDLIRVTGQVVGDARGLALEWDTEALRSDLDSSSWSSPPVSVELVDRGVYGDLVGATLTGLAFDRAIPGLGKYLVTAVCWLFALSTLISWSYYGEQGVVFLFGERMVPAYKVVFCLAAVGVTFPNFIKNDTQLGNLSDLGTGCMLFANVPIILFMGHQAIADFRDYFHRLRTGQMRPAHTAPRIVDVVEGHDVE